MAEHESRVYAVQPVGERVSALEIKVENFEEKLDKIREQLDELLEIKHKGMGAIGLVSLLIISASGLAGVITFVLNFFNHRG
jgi:hypothetical protein